MIVTKSEYDNILICLFDLIISGSPITAEALPNCTEDDLNEILFQCCEDGLILGFSMTRVASGEAAGQRVGKPYVTLKGLTYIDSVKQARALDIAKSAQLQADRAIEELAISREQLKLRKEEVESLGSISIDAKSRSISAQKELELYKEELRFAKQEAEEAKKDAYFSKFTSVLAIAISIIAIIVQVVYR